jgi:FkbM family methyltransferase
MLDFSRVPYRSGIGRLLRFPLRFIPEDAVLPVLQGPLRGRRWVAGSFNHGCWLGSYEMNKQRRFAAALKPDDCVYDIGAHVGFYTLIASVHSKMVYAFEPFPRNLEFLRRHLALNQLTNVQVFPVAVGRETEVVQFQSHSSHAQGRVSSSGDFSVQQVALDQFVAQNSLRLPNVLKIDVEGAEYNVLSGAENLLRDTHPTIFLATHGTEVHVQCRDFLIGLGYQMESLAEDEFLAV